MLSGEYAVLDGAPAVCVAVDRRASVEVNAIDASWHRVTAPGLTDTEGRFVLDGGELTWLQGGAEFDLVGQDFTIGEVHLKGFKRTVRCAATTVNPATAERDMNIPRLLADAFGHSDCGIYARIESGGRLTPGMEIAAPPG